MTNTIPQPRFFFKNQSMGQVADMGGPYLVKRKIKCPVYGIEGIIKILL